MKILSVRLSLKRVDYDKTGERSVQIFIPHEDHLAYSFLRRRTVGGATPSTWNFGSTNHSHSRFGSAVKPRLRCV